MRHVRSLRFDALEARQLLSSGRLAAAQASPVITGPLVLDGSLAVVHKPHAVTITTNLDGSTTTSIPVSGQLGSLGQVRGVWSESVDAYGNYDGPDTLVLRNGKGSVLVAFDNLNTPRTAIRVPGGVNYEHPQRVVSGTRAYAGASEAGTIVVTTKTAHAQPVGLTLSTPET